MDDTFEFHHDKDKKRRKTRLDIKKVKERKFLGKNRSETFDSSPKRKRTRNAQRRFFIEGDDE